MRKKMVLSLIICILLTTVGMKTNATASQPDSREKVIFLSQESVNVTSYLQTVIRKLDMFADDVRKDYDIIGNVSFGMPISVRGTDNIYYIPVFNATKCVAVIMLGVDAYGNYCMQMSKYFADIINDLPCGIYFFEKEANEICLKSEATKIVVSANRYLDFKNVASDINDEFDITLQKNETLIDLYNESFYTSFESDSNRTMTEVKLSIGPIEPNGGAYGYCWLCCALEISDYYGGINTSLSAGHNIAHGSAHTLYNCQEGTRDDVNAVVDEYTGKTGIKTGALTANQTVISIAQSKPIDSVWKNGTLGHSMVIIGYSYDPNNYGFEYIIHDPNYSGSNVHLAASYYATSVSYQIGSNYFTWMYSLYNWS